MYKLCVIKQQHFKTTQYLYKQSCSSLKQLTPILCESWFTFKNKNIILYYLYSIIYILILTVLDTRIYYYLMWIYSITYLLLHNLLWFVKYFVVEHNIRLMIKILLINMPNRKLPFSTFLFVVKAINIVFDQ